MATNYNTILTHTGTSNIGLPYSFGLNGFSRSTTPAWNSGRADQLTGVYIRFVASITRNRDVTFNLVLRSGGVTIQSGNIFKSMTAGGYYTVSSQLTVGADNLTQAQVQSFINGLPTAVLDVQASYSSASTAELVVNKKDGRVFNVSVHYVDLEGSTFSLDKTEYTSGDRPIVTIEAMETDETLTHGYYWTLAGHSTEEVAITGVTETLAALPDDFATYLDGKVSDTLTFHGITYANGVKLGERTVDVIFTARDMIPTVTISAAPSDGGSDYWERFDSCVLTIDCNSAHSTHQSLEVTGDFTYSGDVVSSLTVPIFQAGGTKKFTATYTNGRGQVATASVSIEVKKLKPPTVELFEAQRFEEFEDDDGNAIYKWSLTSQKVRVAYKYSVDDAGGNVTPSDISLAIRYNGQVVRGTSRGMSGQVEYDERSATSADKSILSGSTFDSNSEHVLTFTVSDGKNNSSATVTIPKARVNLHLAGSDYGVGIGCFVTDSTQENPIFRVAYPAEFQQIKAESITLENPICSISWSEDKNVNASSSVATYLHALNIEKDALVLFDANVSFGNNGTGRRILEMYLNGSAVRRIIFPAASGDVTQSNFIHVLNVRKGDVLSLACWQNSGSTLAMISKAMLLTLA